MGDVSRRIIANNYDSVVAAQEMKESLERQDSAAVFALLGVRERAAAQTREHRAHIEALHSRRFARLATTAASSVNSTGFVTCIW